MAMTATPPPLLAAPTRVVPPKKTRKQRRAEQRQRDMSEGGQRRGIIELTLGSLTLAMSAVLIGRGAWELTQAAKLRDVCESGDAPLECLVDDPARGGQIGAGLSFGFAVPFAVAGGFLVARGARIHRDYGKWKRAQAPEVSLIPYGGTTGGGVRLRLRF